MHTLLGGRTEWAGISGFATEHDFIEVPSQTLEEFFGNVELLQSFARHYQTGAPLPAEMIRRMQGADAFGRADAQRAQLNYATLSLDLHDEPPAALDLDQKLRSTYERFQPWTFHPESKMYASFGHLTGYSSNYYTYALDKVIALDFFAQFDSTNLLGCAAGGRYRKTVLEQGGAKPGRQMVLDFLGREEDFSAFTNWLNQEFESGLI
jgi:thimet oligopeptidase